MYMYVNKLSRTFGMRPPLTSTYIRQALGIRQDVSMCRLCATATLQHHVQTRGFYTDLSDIRHVY